MLLGKSSVLAANATGQPLKSRQLNHTLAGSKTTAMTALPNVFSWIVYQLFCVQLPLFFEKTDHRTV